MDWNLHSSYQSIKMALIGSDTDPAGEWSKKMLNDSCWNLEGKSDQGTKYEYHPLQGWMVSSCNLQYVITTPYWVCMPCWPDPTQSIHLCPSSSLTFRYHFSPTSLLCWRWLTQHLPAQWGVQEGPRSTPACCGNCCQNQHGSTGRNTETGSRGRSGPGSLYTEDNVLLARGLLPGGKCSLLWFPIQLYCDLFVHSKAGMFYKDRIFITAPKENPTTSSSLQPGQRGGPESRAQTGWCFP